MRSTHFSRSFRNQGHEPVALRPLRIGHTIRLCAKLAATDDRRTLILKETMAGTRAATAADSLIVVIRTAGERTFETCRALILRQVPDEAVRVLDVHPFESALRMCYQTGMESGAEWILTVDADVLVRPGAVRELLSVGCRMPSSFVQVEGLVHDKLRGRYRKAGHRLYRVKHLGQAVDLVPPPGQELRPESATLEALARIGYPSLEVDTVFGLHDYEQFRRDIYRKAFLHGRKHPQWLGEVLPSWKEDAVMDPDFAVALRGFWDGFLLNGGHPSEDIDERSGYADRALIAAGTVEKGPLTDSDLPRVEESITRALERAKRSATPVTTGSWTLMALRRLGPVRFVPWLAGSVFRRIGGALLDLAERD